MATAETMAASIAVRSPAVPEPKTELTDTPTAAPPKITEQETLSESVADTVSHGLFGGGSGGVTDSPATWVMAAAARRQLGDTATEVAESGSGQTTGQLLIASNIAAAQINSAPVITGTTVGDPNPSFFGWVSGKVNATDPDKDQLTYTASGTTKGWVGIDTNTGSFTYGPNATARHAAAADTATDADKQDNFTVTVTDGHGGTTTQTVKVAVSPQNTAPSANAATGWADPNTGAIAGNVSGSDADWDKLTYAAPTSTTKGTITLNNSTGAFTYTPTAAARHAAAATNAPTTATTDTFTITVTDGHGGTTTKNITVTITPKNSAPVVAATPTVGQADPVSGTVTGTLAATDPDADPLTYTATPSKGTITFGAGGSFSYTPTAAARKAATAPGAWFWDKSDTFTVTVSDAHGAAVNRTLNITVSPMNSAQANSAPVITGTTVGDPNPSFFGWVSGKVTATDPDKDQLTYTATGTTKGWVGIDTNTGSFTYGPNATARHAAAADTATDADKQDNVTVTVTDGHGGTTTQTVKVAVSPQNTAPSANAATGWADPNTGAIAGNVSGSDADWDKLTYAAPTSTTKGTITLNNSTGAFTYTPTAAARHAAAATNAPTTATTDTFTITVTDGHGGTTTKNITVTITPKNSAPVVAATPTIGKPNPTTGIVTGTLAATDPDADPLTYTATPTKGAITFTADGRFTYTPNAAPNAAQDTFSVSVTDDHGGLVTRSLTVPVSLAGSAGLTVVGSTALPGRVDYNAPTLYFVDRDHALVSTIDGYGAIGTTTRTALINTKTGAQTGNTITLSGLGSASLSLDNTRAVVTTVEGASTIGYTTRIALMNAVTGVQIGNALSLTGTGTAGFSADSTRVLVTISVPDLITNINNPDTDNGSTTVLVLDANTATQIGVPLKISGARTNVSSVDDSRAVVTVTEGDSINGYTTHVRLVNTAIGKQIGAGFELASDTTVSALVNADRTRTVITTSPVYWASAPGTTNIAVLDTTTGSQIGTTLALAGNATGAPAISADGKRAVVAVVDGDWDSGYTSRIAVIDTSTGIEIGTPFNLSGNAWVYGGQFLTPDGAHALMMTRDQDKATGIYTSRLAVIDTANGAQIGTTIVRTDDGDMDPIFSPDGNRMVFTTVVSDPVTGTTTTELTTLDLMTGTHGSISVSGAWSAPILLTKNGSRALLRSGYTDPVSGAISTQVAVLDTTSATQTGTTVTFAGQEFGSRLVSVDGSRVLIVTSAYDGRTSTSTTLLSMIDTTTGNQIGTTTSLSGYIDGGAQFSSDSRRVVVSTIGSNNRQVAVIDTTTGNQVGYPLSTDSGSSTTLSTDGSRAFVNMNGQMTVINTISGNFGSVGAGPWGRLMLNADSTMAVNASTTYFFGATTKFTVLRVL